MWVVQYKDACTIARVAAAQLKPQGARILHAQTSVRDNLPYLTFTNDLGQVTHGAPREGGGVGAAVAIIRGRGVSRACCAENKLRASHHLSFHARSRET